MALAWPAWPARGATGRGSSVRRRADAAALEPQIAQLETALDRRPWVSWLLVVANTGLYVYCAAISRDVNVAPEVMAIGWKVPVAIQAGQYWRLVSCLFLHANLLHLVLNMVGILNLGSIVERMIGPAAYLALFLLGGIAGALLSTTYGNYTGVGSSGAVLALLGAAFILAVRFGHVVRGALGRWFAPQLFVLLVLNLWLGFHVPRIDNLAHLGGIVAGLSLAWWCDLRPLRTGRRPLRRGLELGLASAALVTLAVTAWFVGRAAQPARAVQRFVIARLGLALEVPETWLPRAVGPGVVEFSAVGVPARLRVERLTLLREVRPGEEEQVLRAAVRGRAVLSEPAPMAAPPAGRLWHVAMRAGDVVEWYIRFQGSEAIRVTGMVRGDRLSVFRPVFVRAAGTLRDLRPPEPRREPPAGPPPAPGGAGVRGPGPGPADQLQRGR